MKKTTYKKISKIGLLLALFALPVVAFNCRKWSKKPIEERAEHIVKKITKKLDLTDAQKTVLEKIKTEAVAKIKASEQNHKQLAGGLIEQIKSEKLDKAKIKELQKKRSAMMAEFEDFMIEKISEFHAVLTPDQRTKAAEYLEKFRNKMHH